MSNRSPSADRASAAGVEGPAVGRRDSSRRMRPDGPFGRSVAPPGGKANGTPAVPKMGVRARVTDWPPKKEGWDGRPPPNYESVVLDFQNGHPRQSPDSSEQGGGEAPCNYEGPEPLYSLSDVLSHPPHRGLHPVRQRSNSDVTISDIDAEDTVDQSAINPNTGASLHRGYGSASSIDQQGLSGSELFTLLRGYHVDPLEPLDPQAVTPLGFPELLQYDAALSPSLQTAARIARGEIARASGPDYADGELPYGRERERSFMRRLRADPSETTSLFRKLRTVRAEHDGLRPPAEHDDRRPLGFQKCFAHYDVQSVLFNIGEAVANRASLGKRKNTTTGASAASRNPPAGGGPPPESPPGSREDLRESPDADDGDGRSSELVLSCPFFRNEVGGEAERRISLSRAGPGGRGAAEGCSYESSLSSHCTNAGVSVLEVPRESQPVHREKVKRYIIEHIDLGAYYYHKYFYGKEHQNYFGVDENLGPVAVSVRREKLDEGKEKEGTQYNYRVTFRTSELSFQHKVGILYCRAGQSTEEQMYNNESAGPAFTQFLDLLGQRVRLKGFNKYRAQLDNKTDSTGTHSLYTTYKDYELMFHVSTMLPYTPNNRQQLLRKRHIGNDIVTVVFQEPGALPFTPKSIRSHFQHVFVIVKVHNPCTDNVCYSVAVSRSKDVPPFGPPIPKGVTFPKSAVFRDFLLAKVINGENAAHKSEKFRAMATRTRQEYLRDLADNFAGAAPVDSAGKFSFISLGAKRKEKTKPRRGAHLLSVGAVAWNMRARDFARGAHVDCLLAVSNEFIVLIEEASRNVVFNCSCRDVIGWSSGAMSVKVFYERGECVMFSAPDHCEEDVREVVQRLEIVSRGCETSEMTLRRNGLGQLGFHVNFEGIVADVEPFGFAWQAGLRQGSRLVEICTVAVVTLTHEQMIDLLRTSVTVKVVIIQPHEDGTPRRGCSELYRIPMVEYKLDSEGTPCEYKTPFRRNTTWHRVPPPAGQSGPRTSPTPQQASPVPSIPRSTSFDRKLPDGSRAVQDLESPQAPSCSKGDPALQYRSSPSNRSSSSDPGPSGSGTWAQQARSQSPVLQEQTGDSRGGLGDGDMVREPVLDRARSAEAKWHIPSTKILSSLKERGPQREGGKDSPCKLSRVGERNCSSRSSSNTMSSNASSNSDDKHFGSGDLMDPQLLGLTYIKGASTDSGIDTAPCMLAPHVGSAPGGRRSPTSSTTIATAQTPLPGGSIGDLSEISSHSSGSHHSGSPSIRGCRVSGSLDPSRVYAVPQGGTVPGAGADIHATPHQPQANKYMIGWKKAEDTPCSRSKRTWRLEPGTLPGVLSESRSGAAYLKRGHAISARLITMHRTATIQSVTLSGKERLGPPVEESRRTTLAASNLSPRRPLYRTLSDESVCSNRKGSSYGSSHGSALDQALPNDILFSTMPPYRSTLPTRMALGQGATNLRNEFWFSDGSLADRAKSSDPSLMPLPDTASGLDWSHLVDAARAFEDQRVASFCTLTDMQRTEALQISQELRRRAEGAEGAAPGPGESSPTSLTGKVNQLEVILKQLQYDLRKEKEDKAVLQVEVQHLRQDNMRLQEESQAATAQLRKFTDWFFHTIDKKQ
ncbi:hypothetical protein AAFF_G00063080 [Aldrovandia affinis]|uniref:Signal-induced proliferation-associated 1-like protein 2 n=1 Tax=Aldrovandia affinis TaxID=143900 RepID=A0AAD7WDK8_9TELE|nr:hypothetical protein AAFF_G00063080 [Aldrovandia affinis]